MGQDDVTVNAPESRPMKLATKHLTPEEQDAFNQGEADCADGFTRNDYERDSPEWHAYRAGVKAFTPVREAWEDLHDDTPCLEDGRDNCNDWGTGEGQFHGRM